MNIDSSKINKDGMGLDNVIIDWDDFFLNFLFLG